MFSCEFCEISKKTFFREHLRTTVSVNLFLSLLKYLTFQILLLLLVEKIDRVETLWLKDWNTDSLLATEWFENNNMKLNSNLLLCVYKD